MISGKTGRKLQFNFCALQNVVYDVVFVHFIWTIFYYIFFCQITNHYKTKFFYNLVFATYTLRQM